LPRTSFILILASIWGGVSFYLHSRPQHPHHTHHPHHPQHPHHPHHPHHPLRPHHCRHQLIPVTITFGILNFLHRSGQQPHQHQKIGTVCDLQQLQKTA